MKKIEKDKSLEILKLAISDLQEKYGLSLEEIFRLVEKPKILVPVEIFKEKLSPLEALCKYLKETKDYGLNYHDIALFLERNDRTIWTSYNNAIKKKKEKISIKESKLLIPISIFNRKLTILEALIFHLKNQALSYHEISLLINKDERNVWTVYSRARKKIKKKK